MRLSTADRNTTKGKLLVVPEKTGLKKEVVGPFNDDFNFSVVVLAIADKGVADTKETQMQLMYSH